MSVAGLLRGETYLRQQLHGPPTTLDVASRSEALALFDGIGA
jgi:hypothetical protein